MPLVKPQHVASVSSEDPNHPADNLLSAESYRKWKCAAAGEKKAIVVLQLEKATQLHSIDVGSEGSAFVEVLVGRSSAPDTYEVLLGMSTFMTPGDSKQWTNTNRVRMFGKDKFSKGVAEQKWDRVKLVCTQPYNKSEKYGLSFVKLHSTPDAATDAPAPTSPKKLGVFSMKDEAGDLPPGSLFYRRDQQQQQQNGKPPTSFSSSSSSSATSPQASIAAQARMATVSMTTTVSAAVKSPARGIEQSDSAAKKKTSSTPKTERKRGGGAMAGTLLAKKAKSSSKDDTSKPDSSFAKLLEGVVFTLSGFKNPFRGQLRESASEMGARYEPDWSPDCTHLVCAFPNTPKYNQVKAKKGVIVRKEWILDCHAKKRRLPSKSYRLTSGDKDSSSSTDEEGGGGGVGGGNAGDKLSAASRDVGVVVPPDVGVATGSTAGGDGVKAVVPVATGEGEGEDPYGGSTDEESDMDTDDVVRSKPRPLPPADDEEEEGPSSGGDTDDEINRVLRKEGKQDKDTEPYGGSTDEESDAEKDGAKKSSQPVEEKRSLIDLPEFFSKLNFFLYGTFTAADRRLIVRYITAYAGTISDYMNEKVTHVLTNGPWDTNFDQALSENNALVFVKPKWLFLCHQTQACTPHQPYVVAPI